MKKSSIYILFLSLFFLFLVPFVILFSIDNKQNKLTAEVNANFIDQHIEKSYQFDEGDAAAVTRDQDGYDHLYMWGDNSHYQLGLNYQTAYFPDSSDLNLTAKNYYYYPQEVAITKDNKGMIDDLKSTKFNTIVSFIDQDGNYHLYIYGSNVNGLLTKDQLYLNSSDPIIIDIPTNLKIEDLALTDDNVYLLLKEKSGKKQYLYSWGLNINGQLGLGFNDNFIHKTPNVSKYINGLSTDDYEIEQIYAQNDALYLVTKNKNEDDDFETIYTLGSNHDEQLAITGLDYDDNILIPTEIPYFEEIKANNIYLDGNNHYGIYAQYQLLNQTYLVSWGNNRNNQLVNINQNIINQPTGVFADQIGDSGEPIYDPQEKDLLFSNYGYEQSFLIYQYQDQYQLYGWGLNNHYSLGISDNQIHNTEPIAIKSINNQNYQVKGLSTGSHSSSLIIEDQDNNQSLYTWGYNQTGQLGNGEEASFTAEQNTTFYLSLQTYIVKESSNNYYKLPLAIFIVIVILLLLVLITLYISVKRYKVLEAKKKQTGQQQNEVLNQELTAELTTQNLDLNVD
ncbi:MAG: hypothetical protein HPPSJP_1900 [Candidatus Hepatoplasma scabrum]|nr:MAG: hypothetical protein HPPSJP_1900 [Candidatus Hepatoplasma sp.]